MALTRFQSDILKLLADNRRGNEGSYVAEGLAAGEVVFHEGRICGAWPQIVG